MNQPYIMSNNIRIIRALEQKKWILNLYVMKFKYAKSIIETFLHGTPHNKHFAQQNQVKSTNSSSWSVLADD